MLCGLSTYVHNIHSGYSGVQKKHTRFVKIIRITFISTLKMIWKRSLRFWLSHLSDFWKSGLLTLCWNSYRKQLRSVVSQSISIFIWSRIFFYMKKNHSLWPSTRYLYIDDMLSSNNFYFHSYIDSIYPSGLEIKDSI